eukprot:768724-Hanusia_phi.AAC.10
MSRVGCHVICHDRQPQLEETRDSRELTLVTPARCWHMYRGTSWFISYTKILLSRLANTIMRGREEADRESSGSPCRCNVVRPRGDGDALNSISVLPVCGDNLSSRSPVGCEVDGREDCSGVFTSCQEQFALGVQARHASLMEVSGVLRVRQVHQAAAVLWVPDASRAIRRAGDDKFSILRKLPACHAVAVPTEDCHACPGCCVPHPDGHVGAASNDDVTLAVPVDPSDVLGGSLQGPHQRPVRRVPDLDQPVHPS